MKHTLLNQFFHQLTSAKFSLVMLMFTFTMAQINAQIVDCNSVLACNDSLFLSLDENCEAVLTADFLLEAPDYDDSFYTVELTDSDGNIIPGATVDGSYIGMYITGEVSLNGCNLSCSTVFLVEDKLGPVVDCGDNIYLECYEDPNTSPIHPNAYDACSSVTYTYYDQANDLGCNGAYSRSILRTWVVSDTQGNETTCDQHIYIKQGNLEDIVWPINRMGDNAYSCNYPYDTLANGAPDPDFTGKPSNVDCGNIQYYYEDLVFDLCGAGVKTVRNWTVINWCTGQDTSHTQVIEVVDNIAPITVAPIEDYNIGTDDGECTGTWVVPAPIVVQDCSEWTYEVSYMKINELGQPWIDDNVVTVYDNNGNFDYYKITDMQKDSTWIKYTITDACGLSTNAYTELVVVDKEKPTAICEGYTVVSVDDQGRADVFAETFDDHSWDNCGIDRFEVKRLNSYCPGYPEDLEFGDYVNFCCTDIGNGYVKVVMRVYDFSGNFNDCIVNVTVDDKYKPSIECPDNVHITCSQDYTDLTLTGTATGQDNCSNLDIDYTDVKHLNDCGVGYITRTWKATDPQGLFDACTQTIYLDNPDPIEGSDIIFPGELEIEGCVSGSYLHPDSLNSKPIVNNYGCNNIAIGYDDQFFYGVPGYCVKIVRKWSVMDWCSSDSDQGLIIATREQIIKIINNEAPVFDDCSSVTEDAIDATCEKEVTVSASATDDCEAPEELNYHWYIDVDNNGTFDSDGLGSSVTFEFTVGIHNVKFTATDKCGNVGVCNRTVVIRDTKAPTPICLETIVWVLDENGEAVVWASDFDKSSIDNCTPSGDCCGGDNKLRFTFSATPPEADPNYSAVDRSSSMTFDCSDLDNGIAQLIPLVMYVFDESGNSSYCSVNLNLQDNIHDACTDVEGAVASIAGKVMFTNEQGINDLNVTLKNITDEEDIQENTGTDGDFVFEDLGFYDTYKVTADVEGPIMEGVSTLDLVLIQRHILQLKEFDNPYSVIAADVNNSKSISGADLIVLRKLILGKIDAFTNNTSWKYIDASTEFEEIDAPWEYIEDFTINSLYLSEDNANLYAIKIGDVNQSTMESYTSEASASRYRQPMNISLEDVSFEASDIVNASLMVADEAQIEGMQFTIEFDSDKLSFVDISSEQFGLTKGNISKRLIERGKVLVSWNAKSSIELQSDVPMMNIQFKAINKGELSKSFAINSDVLSAEIYNSQLEILDIVVDFDSKLDIESNPIILSNSPNPFSKFTNVMFDLSSDQDITLTIRDLNGSIVKRLEKQGFKGRNTVVINKNEIGSQGIFVYTLESKDIIVTKRMIIVE